MSDEPQTVRARVTLDGDVIEADSFDIDADDFVLLDCTWPEEPGQFVVRGRFEDDEEWTERDLTDLDSDCASVSILVGRTGDSIGFFDNTDCEQSGPAC